MSSAQLFSSNSLSPATYHHLSVSLKNGRFLFFIPFSNSKVGACINVDVRAPDLGKIGFGAVSKEVMEEEGRVLVGGTYAKAPVVPSSGKGCKLFAVNALGRGDPDLIRAVTEQATMFTHVGNVFYSIPQVFCSLRCLQRKHYVSPKEFMLLRIYMFEDTILIVAFPITSKVPMGNYYGNANLLCN
ncbi:unnamed protein product [Ilex paraguariensis]|uniref:Uncharacterized protein n=1 Tax=Ilex paraguariensis TaxID=185542 RepID=A0ABC8UTJ2_9AQUA